MLMIKKWALAIAFLLSIMGTLSAETTSQFASRLEKAKIGDFIVAKQPGYYCLLLIKSQKEKTIVFEEIDIPDYAVDLKKIDWKTWVASRAPGHSSWILLEVNLDKWTLRDAYSVKKRCFLQLSEEEQFLLKLLTLPTTRLNSEERRKIGAPPLAGEEDHRPIWQPKIHFEGKERRKPTTVYRASWPHDQTLLSGSKIDFFFDDFLPSFSFPIWIEIYGGHYKSRIAIIEAGHDVVSPAETIPKRPPKIMSMPKKVRRELVFDVVYKETAEKFELYAMEVGPITKPPIRLLHEMERIDAETVRLTIPATLIEDRLQVDHRYRLAMMPVGHPECYIETEESFLVINNAEQ